MLSYDELVQFAEWIERRQRAYVCLSEEFESDEQSRKSLTFDGTIYPEDVERFNQERKARQP